MEYNHSSQLTKTLQRYDIVCFRINGETKEYKIDSYYGGYFLHHSYNYLNVLSYLSIIDIEKYVKKYNCNIHNDNYSSPISNLVSTNLEDLTVIVKELMIISEKVKK